MNQRIKQLAEQAGLIKILDEHASEYGNGMFENTPYPELAKFAELIVRECAQVSEDDITDGDACCTNTADRIARQIKKHFGVEE